MANICESFEVMSIFRPSTPRFSDIQLQLKEMDAAGVDLAIISTACLQQWNTMEMAREINDAIAELQHTYPTRFVGLAHVPPFGEGVGAELERAVRHLGLKGAALTTHFNGKYPHEEVYRPFFKKAEELDIPVCFHAAAHPADYHLMEQIGVVRSVGRLLDHSLAAAAILYKVAKDFPNLKFLHAHLGGSFFIIKERLLDAKFFRVGAGDEPFEEIIDRQFFFDTAPARFESYHIECAIYNLGSDHILLGSDYPVKASFLPNSLETLKKVRFPEEDKRKMFGENAIKLFKL